MNNHLEAQLSAYMDDELNDVERQEVEAHLESCTSCQVLLEDILSMHNNLICTFDAIQEPVDLEMRIMQTIARDRQKSAFTSKGWLLFPVVALLALGIAWFAAGPLLVKVVHGFVKLLIALVYMGSHLISGVPVLSGLTVVLSIIIITTSIYSLRRLLQTSTS